MGTYDDKDIANELEDGYVILTVAFGQAVYRLVRRDEV